MKVIRSDVWLQDYKQNLIYLLLIKSWYTMTDYTLIPHRKLIKTFFKKCSIIVYYTRIVSLL